MLGTDHHRHTFEALRALDLGELSTIAREMNAFRRSRHQAIYDWDENASDVRDEATSLASLTRRVDRLMELAHAWLTANRPAVSGDFDAPGS